MHFELCRVTLTLSKKGAPLLCKKCLLNSIGALFGRPSVNPYYSGNFFMVLRWSRARKTLYCCPNTFAGADCHLLCTYGTRGAYVATRGRSRARRRCARKSRARESPHPSRAQPRHGPSRNRTRRFATLKNGPEKVFSSKYCIFLWFSQKSVVFLSFSFFFSLFFFFSPLFFF